MYGNKPADFESFWDDVDNDLAGIAIAPEVEYIRMRSNNDADLYGVRITSVGPYRLFA